MQLPMEEDNMRTTTQRSRLIATVFVLALGVLTFGVFTGMAAPHEPKAGLGNSSQVRARGDSGDDHPGTGRGVQEVQIADPAHRAVVENARRHGLKVRNMMPTGSRPAYVAPVSTTSKVTAAADARGGFSWTYPGVLAGLVLAFALVAGGIVLVARRLRSRTVTA